MEIRLVPLDQIPWEECFASQYRRKMSTEHIDKLRELVSESDEEQQQTGAPLRTDLFPPLVVFTKGGLTDLFYLADGFHRYEALEQAGRDAWPCEVHVVPDPQFAAREYGLKANTTHGLPRDSETCKYIFECARKMFPNLDIYGKNGIEGKTGLSRGFLHIHAKRLKDAGKPDAHEVKSRTNPNLPNPPADLLRAERVDSKCNPNYEPAPSIEDEPETEDIVEAAKPKGKLIDKLGRSIAPGLRPKFNGGAVAELVRKMGMLISEVDALAGQPGWEYLDVAGTGRTIKTAQNAIKAAEYYTECPRCDMDKSCKLCKGAGFITSIQFARLDDREKAGLKE